MIDFIPPKQIRGGIELANTREIFRKITENYPYTKVHLDLSSVEYMDTSGFRLIFDFKSKFPKITPPKCEHICELYDVWVESKKGLSK